jgi:SAM-dependent methyltransferase
MSWLLARVYDRLLLPTEEACVSTWRAELLSSVHGDVLEIGAGTGLNLPHYPSTVERLTLAEPDPHMRRQLERRLAAARRPDTHVSAAGLPDLPFDSDRFDAIVSTLVLCSVPDPASSLASIHRILKPGGTFVFLEHVAAEEHPSRLKWQHRIDPLWKRVFGGCRLTRRTADTITAAGLTIESLTRESMRRANPLVRTSIRGIARKVTPSA